jgi:hypothetical protein
MLFADTLNPPIQYDRIWFIIGAVLLFTIPLWYGVAFWITRRKSVKSIDKLKRLPTGVELEKLKAKYLQLIDQWHRRYLNKEINLRELHRALSMTARYFVYEARHFPAQLFTLDDLKHAPYPALTKLIAGYYPEEFAAIEHGSAANSVEAAKGFIIQWF